MNGHTEGSWLFRINGFNEAKVELKPRNRASTREIILGGMERTTLEDIANARLIAAAPALLLACEMAAEVFELSMAEGSDDMAIWSVLNNAIKKAKGERA